MAFKGRKFKWKSTPHRKLLARELLRNRMLERRVQRDQRFLVFERTVLQRYGQAVLAGGRWTRGFWAIAAFLVRKVADKRRSAYRSGPRLSEAKGQQVFDAFAHAWGNAHAAQRNGSTVAAWYWNLRKRAAEVKLNRFREVWAGHERRAHVFGVGRSRAGRGPWPR